MAATIELYLVRHAIAAERGPKYPDDRLRPLTNEGRKRFEESIPGAVCAGVELDLVLTSPLVRAQETAAILANGLRPRPSVQELEALAPGGRHALLVEAITKFAKRHRRIAMVGHEPDLGEFGARLIGARGTIEFKKGAICAIDLDGATPGGPGTLRWLLPPRVLRGLGK
jgi:phosphohistidine phosphatase